jgi:sortase A
LTVGDEFSLLLPEAELVYEVIETKQVRPEDTSVLDDVGDDRVTLITCDPPFTAKFRLIAVGRLAKIRR